MALAGALIVFSGLVILSSAISQLHRVLSFFENLFNRGKARKAGLSSKEVIDHTATASSEKEKFPDNLDSVVERFKAVSEPLGQAFPLVELYRLAREIDDPHPHLTITHLRQHQFLIPQGDGIFSWR